MKLKLFIRKQNRFPVEDEVLAIWHMLMPAESFRAFRRNKELFDMDKQKRITNRKRLFNIYSNEISIDSSVFIVNKN